MMRAEVIVPTYGWLLDPKRCIECRACEVACIQVNRMEPSVGLRYRRVRILDSGVYPAPNRQVLSLACQNCENPLCTKVCATRACHARPDGIVLIDQERCNGCGLCQQFCPYGALQLHPLERKMHKCVSCFDRVDAGLKPACTTVCPTAALQWAPWEEVRTKGSAGAAGFANPSLTRPRVRFAAGWED